MGLRRFYLGGKGVFSAKENQKKQRQRDTCQHQEGNGEAAYGQVRKNSGTETRYYTDCRTDECHDAGDGE